MDRGVNVTLQPGRLHLCHVDCYCSINDVWGETSIKTSGALFHKLNDIGVCSINYLCSITISGGTVP